MGSPRQLAARPKGAPYDCVRVLDWSPDGTLLAMADSDDGVCVVELDDWRLVHRVGRSRQARFVPRASALAIVGDEAVHVFDMANGWTRRSFPVRAVHALELSPDGALLAVGGLREISVWAVGEASAAPLYSVPHRAGFQLELAVDAERLVAYSMAAPPGMVESCLVWSAEKPAAAPVSLNVSELCAALQTRHDSTIPGGAAIEYATRRSASTASSS
jgi:hypothetical protein